MEYEQNKNDSKRKKFASQKTQEEVKKMLGKIGKNKKMKEISEHENQARL